MKLKVLITRPLPPQVVEAARAAFEVNERESHLPMDAGELRASLRDFDMVLPTLGDNYSADVFADVPEPRCRFLANFGMGYNHLDVAAARAAGIGVSNTPGAVTDATADIAAMLMLMSARRASEGERMLRAGLWDGWHPVQMLGLHVTGKTAGIVGMGRIGKAIARRCHHGFGMRIVFHNRSRVEDAGVPAEQLDSLHAVMAAADVVLVAVPGGPATHHLIDAAALAAMQPHAHLVNVSRGDVVDEAALIDVLEAGAIGGAGLDVYEREPEVPERLRALDNAVLIPHLGTAALEVRTQMGLMAVANLEAAAAGKVPPNLLQG